MFRDYNHLLNNQMINVIVIARLAQSSNTQACKRCLLYKHTTHKTLLFQLSTNIISTELSGKQLSPGRVGSDGIHSTLGWKFVDFFHV